MFISRVITRREGKNPRFRGRSIVWRVYKPTQVWGKQQTKELKFQREVEKKIVIVEGRFPRKMVRSSSDAKAPRTKATTSQQGKQTGVKSEKTHAQKVAHRDICRKSRERIKIRNNQTLEENKKMKKELEEKESKVQRMEEEIQEYKRAVEEQKEKEAQMWQFVTSLEIEGQSFSTSEQMSDYLLSLNYEPHHQGVLDSVAGSFPENYDDWIEELLQPDAAAGISHTENLVVENQNNELVNQIDHNAMVQRRELSPAQRSAENKRDRQDMPEHNITLELERPSNVVVKYEEIAPLFNTIRKLAEDSKRMKHDGPYLAGRIQELDNIVRQHVLLL